MRTRFLPPVCVLLAISGLPAREFTDVQGRKLEAEIVSVTGDMVALLRPGEKQPIGAKIAIFSEGDQKFIQEWAAANIKYRFDVAYAKKKLDSAKGMDGPFELTTETWTYRIDLKNRQAVDLADLRVDYWLFTKSDEGKGKGTARVQTSGTTKIEAIKGSGVMSFETEPVVLRKTALKGNYITIDGTRPKYSDAMGGIVVRVFNNADREVFSYATDPNLLPAATGRPKAGSNSERSTSSPK